MERDLEERIGWVVDGLEEPREGTLYLPPTCPKLTDVYLVTPYRQEHLDIIENWVKPALHFAGYQGVLIKGVHGSSIGDAERRLAQLCAFAVAHMGVDDRPNLTHQLRVHAEIKLLLSESKTVVGIRPSAESHLEIADDIRELVNCHPFDFGHGLARWLYKILTVARPDAATVPASR